MFGNSEESILKGWAFVAWFSVRFWNPRCISELVFLRIEDSMLWSLVFPNHLRKLLPFAGFCYQMCSKKKKKETSNQTIRPPHDIQSTNRLNRMNINSKKVIQGAWIHHPFSCHTFFRSTTWTLNIRSFRKEWFCTLYLRVWSCLVIAKRKRVAQKPRSRGSRWQVTKGRNYYYYCRCGPPLLLSYYKWLLLSPPQLVQSLSL